MNDALGRLERVDLRKIWPDEAQDFTPWLAKKENLALLDETLGLELELEETEQSVGAFSADIVCRDAASESLVLIENQIEPTNHTHLGQTLTYAAGLDAVTIIWIASKFRDEHRAMLDWLNEKTEAQLSFFALEIELWRIGNSAPAPKFNIVARPNDWTARMSRSVRQDSSPVKLQYERFWEALSVQMLSSNRPPKPQSPRPQNWTDFGIGRTDFVLRASRSHQKGQLQVVLCMKGPNSRAHFKLLEEQRATLESAIGSSIDWTERPPGKECILALSKTGVDPTDENDWADQVNWTRDTIHRFYDVFYPIIEKLDASDWNTEPDESS